MSTRATPVGPTTGNAASTEPPRRLSKLPPSAHGVETVSTASRTRARRSSARVRFKHWRASAVPRAIVGRAEHLVAPVRTPRRPEHTGMVTHPARSRASSRAAAPRGLASWCWFRVRRVTPCESPQRPKATARRARARGEEAHRCRPAWRGGPRATCCRSRQLLSVPTTTSPRPGRPSTSTPIGEMERSRVGEHETASRTGTGDPGHRSRSASRHGGFERGDTLIEVP